MRTTRGMHLRSLRCAPLVLIVACGMMAPAWADSLAERVNRGLVEVMIRDDATSIEMALDLARVLDDGATRRVLPVIGRGAVESVIDLRLLRGVDMSIVQTDVLDYARQHDLPHLENSVTYVAKLHNEELHVLASADTKRIEDLAGKKVDFVGSARVTGPAVLGLLQVKVEPVFDDPALALRKLKSGEVAALALVAAKPTPRFDALRDSDQLHFLPIPLTPALANAYVPAQLTAEDYPSLVRGQAAVDTVAVGSALVIANLQLNTERYRNTVNFVDAFFTQLPRLQEATHHPKWAEVNLAAELPGWKRFPPADAWLKRNLTASAPPTDEKDLRDTFVKFLDERTRAVGSQTLSAEQKNQLFDQFRAWQSNRH